MSLLLLFSPAPGVDGRRLSYTEFVEQVERGNVRSVKMRPDGQSEGTLSDGSRFVTTVPVALGGERLLERLENKDVRIDAVPAGTGSVWLDVLVSFAPFFLLFGLFVLLGRRAGRQLGGVMGIGRSGAKVFDSERPKTRLDDVAGYEGVKREVGEIVDFLRKPDRYRRAGAIAPRGVLMAGPPRYRQDPPGPGHRRRGPRTLPVRHRLQLRRDVRRRGRRPGQGPLRRGPQAGPGHHLHRRDRRVIDSEVDRLLREAEHRALELLREHHHQLDRLTTLLLEHETVDGETVYELLDRPAPNRHPEAPRDASPPSSSSTPGGPRRDPVAPLC